MSSHKPDDVAYEYVGKDGAHLATIPATDVTFADLDLLSPLALRDLAHSDLYKPVTRGVPRLQQEPSEEAPPPPEKVAVKGGKDS